MTTQESIPSPALIEDHDFKGIAAFFPTDEPFSFFLNGTEEGEVLMYEDKEEIFHKCYGSLLFHEHFLAHIITFSTNTRSTKWIMKEGCLKEFKDKFNKYITDKLEDGPPEWIDTYEKKNGLICVKISVDSKKYPQYGRYTRATKGCKCEECEWKILKEELLDPISQKLSSLIDQK